MSRIVSNKNSFHIRKDGVLGIAKEELSMRQR